MASGRNLLPLVLPAVLGTTLLLGLAIAALPGSGVDAGRATGLGTTDGARFDAFDHHFRRGVDLLLAGRAGESAALFELARQLRPDVPELEVNLGFAYLEANDAAAAFNAFSRALGLRSGQANAYYGLGEALDRLGDRAGAHAAMRRYVDLTPESDPFRRRAMAALWEWETAAAEPSPEQRAAGQ